MKFDQFTINRGRNYRQHQRGLVAAVTEARRLAAQHDEIVTVYADWTNYGYSVKPMLNCSEKLSEVTAREIVYVRPDGSLAHVNRATPASTKAFFAELNARLDAEAAANAPSEAAQALAASWAADTRTEDQRLAEFYGTMAASDATADHSALTYLRATSERSSHDNAVANATLAAHYGRLHLVAA